MKDKIVIDEIWMEIKDWTLFTKHKFNWIQKVMWKICFGITVKNYKVVKE